MKRFLWGVVIGLLVPVLVGGIVLETGAVDMSATKPPGGLERWLGDRALQRSLTRRAPKGVAAPVPNAEVLASGLEHFRANCLPCHGAPGIATSEAGKGLHPPAPPLDRSETQARSDGELFFVVGRGVRMTGMPAFGLTHNEKELWALVTFIRHLPTLTPEERHRLAEAEPHPATGEEAPAPPAKRSKPEHRDQPSPRRLHRHD
jgi:mono/diheme cytochrome c family protein